MQLKVSPHFSSCREQPESGQVYRIQLIKGLGSAAVGWKRVGSTDLDESFRILDAEIANQMSHEKSGMLPATARNVPERRTTASDLRCWRFL
jgi:hypothetical protein